MICNWKTWVITLTAVLMASSISRSLHADDFEHQFNASTPFSPAFVSNIDPQDSRISGRNGLRFLHRGQSGDLPTQRIRTVFAIRGDGESRLDFSCATLDTPNVGSGSGVYFDMEIVGPKEQKVTMVRLAEKDGSQIVRIDLKLGNDTKTISMRYPIGIFPLLAEPSAFIIARQGRSLRMAAMVDDERIELTEKNCPEGDIFPIGIRVSTGEARSSLDCTLKTLRVSGAELPTDSLVPPEPTARWTIAAVAFATMLCALVAILARNRIRSK